MCFIYIIGWIFMTEKQLGSIITQSPFYWHGRKGKLPGKNQCCRNQTEFGSHENRDNNHYTTAVPLQWQSWEIIMWMFTVWTQTAQILTDTLGDVCSHYLLCSGPTTISTPSNPHQQESQHSMDWCKSGPWPLSESYWPDTIKLLCHISRMVRLNIHLHFYPILICLLLFCLSNHVEFNSVWKSVIESSEILEHS